jgi:invasion protein IalB
MIQGFKCNQNQREKHCNISQNQIKERKEEQNKHKIIYNGNKKKKMMM